MPRSLPAFGLQQFPAAIFPVELAYQRIDIELLAQASIKLANADLGGRPKLIEPRDALKLLAASSRALTIFINDITFLCLAAGRPGPIG